MKIPAKVFCRSILALAFAAAGAVAVSANTPVAAISLGDMWRWVFADGGEKSGDAANNFNVTLRNSITGERVKGRVNFLAGDGTTFSGATDEAGRGGFRLASGRNEIQITAAGYDPIATHFDGGQPLDVTVWLDPQTVPAEMRPEIIASRAQPGMTFIHGHIIDDESGRPIEGARVFLTNAGAETISDKRGYYQMTVPTPPVDPRGDLPGTDELVVASGARVIYRRG